MNRWLSPLVLPALLAGTALVVLLTYVQRSWVRDPPVGTKAGVPAPSPDTAVFEMTYRGLSGLDDPLSQYFFSGLKDQDDPNGLRDPFVRAVLSQIKNGKPLRNDRLRRAQWAVVEFQGQEPVALYFDRNADGRLSEEERSLPGAARPDMGIPHAFVTPDFTLATQDGREMLFRYILVRISGSTPYQWGPCCVLEGQANLAGEPTKLILYPDKSTAPSFTTFGSSSYTLFPGGPRAGRYPARHPLSSLIEYQGTFYRLKLDGMHEKGKTVRVTLEKDTRPTGRWAVDLQGKETLQARLERATINGAGDNSIHFDLSDTQSPVPHGRYRLSSASITYGVQQDSDWKVAILGPEFEIEADKTRPIHLGGPVPSIRAIAENERGRSDAKARTTFAKGTSIYLIPQIQGQAGDRYAQFFRKNPQNSFVGMTAHVAILDEKGKAVASGDVPYT